MGEISGRDYDGNGMHRISVGFSTPQSLPRHHILHSGIGHRHATAIVTMYYCCDPRPRRFNHMDSAWRHSFWRRAIITNCLNSKQRNRSKRGRSVTRPCVLFLPMTTRSAHASEAIIQSTGPGRDRVLGPRGRTFFYCHRRYRYHHQRQIKRLLL